MTLKGKGDTGVFNKPAEKKGAVADVPIRNMAAGRFLVSAWIVTLFLSIYGVEALWDRVVKNESQEWVKESVAKIGDFAEWSGIADAKKTFDGLADPLLNGPSVLKRVEDAPEERLERPPATVEQVHEEDSLPHKVAPTKRRILIVGASSIQGHLGTALVQAFNPYGGIKVKRFGKLSTGLVRPDQLDWPKKLDELAEEFKPDLIITNFGGNDAQGIKLERRKVAKFGTAAWDAEYAKRVQAIVEIGNKYNAQIINLGMPVMRSKKFSRRMKRLNRVIQKATEEAGAIFVSTWEMAATPYGTYRKSVKYEGERGLMRASDGIHYSRIGARFVVDQITQILERRFRFNPLDGELASVTRHTLSSRKLNGERSYLAFVPPSTGANQKFPVIYLLHDKKGDWSSWSKRVHRALQRASLEHQVVFITPDLGAEVKLLDGAATEEFFTQELLKDVARHLPVGEMRSVLGIGSGGGGAIGLALRYPELFLKGSSFGAEHPFEGESLVKLVEQSQVVDTMPSLLMSVGVDDATRGEHDELRALLVSRGVNATILEHTGRTRNHSLSEQLVHHIAWHLRQHEKKPSTTGVENGASDGS